MPQGARSAARGALGGYAPIVGPIVIGLLAGLVIAAPYLDYVSGPEPIEWGPVLAIIGMLPPAAVAVVVGVVIWAVGRGRGPVRMALGRGLVVSPVAAVLICVVASMTSGR